MSDQPTDGPQQPAPGQPAPGWGSVPPPPGAPPAGPPQQWGSTPPRHSGATTALVLGILGLALCQLLAPVAWYVGGQAVKEIDAAPWSYSGRSEANAGRIMGIIGTVLIILAVLVVLGFIATAVTFSTS